jgi:hypothetical protein
MAPSHDPAIWQSSYFLHFSTAGAGDRVGQIAGAAAAPRNIAAIRLIGIAPFFS